MNFLSVCVCACVSVVSVRVGVLNSLKHPVAAALHICLTAATTGKPQLSLQSQLKCYEVEFPSFIYLFLLAVNSQTVSVSTQNCLQASSACCLWKTASRGPSEAWRCRASPLTDWQQREEERARTSLAPMKQKQGRGYRKGPAAAPRPTYAPHT